MDWIVSYLLSLGGSTPYIVVFLVLLSCGLGMPVPEDITLAASGLLAYHGKATVEGMVLVGLLGVLSGDVLIFFIGRKFGRKIAHLPLLRNVLTDAKLDRAQHFFENKGHGVLFVGRFMPGFRAPIFFSAGALQIPFRTFIAFDGSAALLSVPAIVVTVFKLGHRFSEVVETIRSFEHGILAVVALVAAYFLIKWQWSRSRNRS